MMKTVKHLSVLLAVLLTVSLLVVGFAVNAAEPAVTAIETEEQLLAFVNGLNNGTVAANTNAALKADITLTNGMDMINPAYTGTFDGEGHTISGINNTMFKEFQGTIKNVIFRGAIDYTEKTDIRWPATVALEAKNGTAVVENIISYVDITSKCSNINAGGIVGYAKHNFTMRNCEYAGNFNLNWAGSNAGYAGLVGWINTSNSVVLIEDCVFTGTLTLDVNSSGTMYIGGIAGHIGSSAAGATIKNCVNLGTIKVNDTNSMNIWVGGIVSKFNTNNKHVIEGCVNNGQYNLPTMIPVSGILGMCEDAASAGSTVKNCVSLNDSGFVFDGLNEATVINSFAQKDVEKIGEPVVVNGEAYQQYNFGYLNVATSKLYSKLPAEAFVEGVIAKGDDGKYTIDTDRFSAFISAREGIEAGKTDYRFIVAADVDAFDALKNPELVLTFVKNGETVKTLTKNVVADLEVYASATAAGITYVTAEGALLTGVVVTDVPAEAWDTVTVTLVDDENDVAEGKVVAADVEAEAGEDTPDTPDTPVAPELDYTDAINLNEIGLSNVGVEDHHGAHDNNLVLAFYLGNNDAWAALYGAGTPTTENGLWTVNEGYTAIVTVNGVARETNRFTYYGFKDDAGVTNRGFFRFELAPFADLTTNGITCTITTTFTLVGADNKVICYANFEDLKYSTLDYEADADNPGKAALVVTPISGPDFDGGEGTKKLFDNKTTTKLCKSDRTPVVFSLAEAKALGGISLVTANDNQSYTGRIVTGFTLYGGNSADAIDNVVLAVTEAGMADVNFTEYYYAITDATAYQYYKIVFDGTNTFQFSELWVYEK